MCYVINMLFIAVVLKPVLRASKTVHIVSVLLGQSKNVYGGLGECRENF